MTHATDSGSLSEKPLLPDDFVFSQSSLQAYVDCKRRFWLAYLNRVYWPSPPASPVGEYEHLLRLGDTFHRIVQRAEEGVVEDTQQTAREHPLETWIRAYREHRPTDLPAAHAEVERVLEVPVDTGAGARRLMAKYDLIAADNERTVIIDWKTGARIPRPAILQQKMQTSVYPYVLVEAGHALPWGPIAPESVEMRYWYAAAPDQPVIFHYDAAQHAAGRDTISRLIREILSGTNESDFPKVPDTPHTRKYVCGFCTFRGLCDRGAMATDLAELEDATPDELEESAALLDFVLEDVEPIAF